MRMRASGCIMYLRAHPTHYGFHATNTLRSSSFINHCVGAGMLQKTVATDLSTHIKSMKVTHCKLPWRFFLGLPVTSQQFNTLLQGCLDAGGFGNATRLGQALPYHQFVIKCQGWQFGNREPLSSCCIICSLQFSGTSEPGISPWRSCADEVF
jgi:hypothetical protein